MLTLRMFESRDKYPGEVIGEITQDTRRDLRGRSATSLVVDNVTTSPPPRSLLLGCKRHQRNVRDFRSPLH